MKPIDNGYTSYLSTGLLVTFLAAGGCTDVDDPSSIDETRETASAVVGNQDVVQRQTAAVPQSERRSEFPADARVTTTGDDCPDEFTVAPSGDFEAITLRFSENMLTTERRSFRCRIGIDYQFPAGWRLWRPEVFALGVQVLPDAGQRMAWVVRTRLSEGAWKSAFALTPGPVQDDVLLEVPDGERLGEAPTACGATSAHIDVEILGSLFLGAGTPSATPLGTLDSLDTEIDWERCP